MCKHWCSRYIYSDVYLFSAVKKSEGFSLVKHIQISNGMRIFFLIMNGQQITTQKMTITNKITEKSTHTYQQQQSYKSRRGETIEVMIKYIHIIWGSQMSSFNEDIPSFFTSVLTASKIFEFAMFEEKIQFLKLWKNIWIYQSFFSQFIPHFNTKNRRTLNISS